MVSTACERSNLITEPYAEATAAVEMHVTVSPANLCACMMTTFAPLNESVSTVWTRQDRQVAGWGHTLSFLWYSLRAGKGPYSTGMRRVRRALGTRT